MKTLNKTNDLFVCVEMNENGTPNDSSGVITQADLEEELENFQSVAYKPLIKIFRLIPVETIQTTVTRVSK